MVAARSRLVALALVALAWGCDDTHRRDGVLREAPPDRSAPTPTPLPPVPEPTQITYRVIGTIQNVQITYVSSISGTTQVTSDLPWFASFQTRDPSVFIYLAAEAPVDNLIEGSLTVQVFVNGALFREARATGFLPSVAVSGEVTR